MVDPDRAPPKIELLLAAEARARAVIGALAHMHVADFLKLLKEVRVEVIHESNQEPRGALRGELP
jgi:hypothetical protein